MSRFPEFGWCFLCLLACITSAHGDEPVSGDKLFSRTCQGCHSIGPTAKNMFGPQLNGLFERAPVSLDEYEYSSAFRQKQGSQPVWNEAMLDEFLSAPMEYVVGTKMAFPGIESIEERTELISYLSAVGVDGELPDSETQQSTSSKKQARSKVLPKDAEVPKHGSLHLGRVALPAEIAAWDIDVRPDGQGLPDGRGSVLAGTDLYDTNCAVCHGVFGEGAVRWPVLAGGQGSLAEDRPEKTIGSYWPYLSTVYDYIRRAMPFGNARSLSDDDVYAVTAYLLYLNDLVDEDFELNSDNFTSIRLPNEDNFIADNRQLEAHVQLGQEPCMTDCMAAPARVVQRARILDVTPDNENDDEAAAGAID